jgi:hypothetical protein
MSEKACRRENMPDLMCEVVLLDEGLRRNNGLFGVLLVYWTGRRSSSWSLYFQVISLTEFGVGVGGRVV